MTGRFTSSPQDPRRLSMLPQDMARQSPWRRHHIHGPILPMHPPRALRMLRRSTWFSLAVAAAAGLYFGGQLCRPIVERMFS